MTDTHRKSSLSVPKCRLDDLLVARDLAGNKAEAQALIMAGAVIVNDQREDKAGTLISQDAAVRIRGQKTYVSRGGDKLAGALEDFAVESTFRGARVLDVGASTGGFTDCALQKGAAHVTSVDVGTNQLDWSLRNDPRVTALEKTDIRDFAPSADVVYDWVVGDVSFISLSEIAEAVLRLMTSGHTQALLLVKPQFELPAKSVPVGGVVLEPAQQQLALRPLIKLFALHALVEPMAKQARIKGRDGNQEWFLYFKKC